MGGSNKWKGGARRGKEGKESRCSKRKGVRKEEDKQGEVLARVLSWISLQTTCWRLYVWKAGEGLGRGAEPTSALRCPSHTSPKTQ